MAEPFSIATGVLGIVALGNQVCSGVYKYLGTIKDRNKELVAAWDAARTLAAVLERLDGIITQIRAERPDDAVLLSRCLTETRIRLLELRDVVAKLEGLPEAPSLQNTAGSSLRATERPEHGLMGRAKQLGRTMTYTYHRDGVNDLRVALQQLTTSLNSAMLAVDLNEGEERGKNIKSLQAAVSSAELSIDSKAAEIRSAVASLSSQHQAAAAGFQSAAQETAAKMCELQDGLSSDMSLLREQISATEEVIHGTTLQLDMMREEARIHGQDVLAQLQMIRGQLRHRRSSATGSMETMQAATQVVQCLSPDSLRQALDVFPWCQCRATTARSTTSCIELCGLHIFSRQENLCAHERNCPLHAATQRRTRAVGARIRIHLSSFLSFLVEASLTWSTGGAGGSSFGPSVRWKNLVPSGQSPVHRELYSVGLWLLAGRKPSPTEVAYRLQMLQKSLLGMYQKGEASINDVDELSNNHLQNFVQLLIRWVDHKPLTRQVADVAMSIIQFYVEAGLSCNERDTQSVTPAKSLYWNFLPSFKASTTLAKSADLFLPYIGGRATGQSIRLVSSIAQASNPVFQDFVRMVPFVDSSLLFTRILDHETCMEKISPLARAIITRSLDDLESAIRLCPESLLEKTQGLTVLHLSIGWPPGLSLLLRTDAMRLLDTPDDIFLTGDGQPSLSWPFSYAAANQCAQSLDLILQAGCNLYPVDPRSGKMTPALSCALQVTSANCAEVLAFHMARRREDLFALARSNLDKIRVQSSSLPALLRAALVAHFQELEPARPDEKATTRQFSERSTICAVVMCLERAMVPIPVPLRQSGPESEDIYHLPGLSLAFFPIFNRHGFSGYNEPNQHGLRPIMADVRSFCSLSRDPLADKLQDLQSWLVEHGCLDMRPAHSEKQPRLDMKLNEGATGWHYVSLMLVISTWGRRAWYGAQDNGLSDTVTGLMATLAEGEPKRHRDGCVCWCTLPPAPHGYGTEQREKKVDERYGRGCSPFSYLCKQYLQHDSKEFVPNYFRQRVNRHHFWHHLFRHGRRASCPSDTALASDDTAAEPTGATPVPAWQLELLRLLTFEALEMTHTCCSAHRLQPGGTTAELVIFDHPDPEGTRLRLAAEPAEARKVRQLEELMAEFAGLLGRRAGCSPRDLEDFVSGAWRARVAGLYETCDREIGALEGLLGGRVQTKVLPETLQKFFGEDFSFFDDRGNNSGMPVFGPNTDISVAESPLRCNYCPRVDEFE